MKWSPIQRVDKQVENGFSVSTSLLKIRIELSRNPPDEWIQAFLDAKEASKSSTIHPPKINGKNIYITPPSYEIEVYIKHIDERIAGANKYYKNTILPRIQQKEAAREADENRKRSRIEKAQSELDNID